MERETTHTEVTAFARRWRRGILGGISVAALFLAGAVGCTGWSADSCDQYLLCVSATMPLAQSEQLALYGKDGSCWKQIEPEQCAKSCKAGLRALAANSTAKECHPTTSSGDDQTGDPPPAAFSWPLPAKSGFYSGPTEDPKLSGEDPVTGDWLCTRDDKNQSPSEAVRRMSEPNDLPEQAIVLPNPLPVDLPMGTGTNYEICADRSAPSLADFDTFKFKLVNPGRIVTEIKYQVKYGDLDLAVFRDDVGPMPHNLTLAGASVTGKDNACLSRDLQPGTYYLVVWGARDPVMQTKTAMNRYQLRVFEDVAASYTCP